MTDPLPISALNLPKPEPVRPDRFREVAEKLEASFLAEMLKGTGLGAQENSFSGGIGEDQFASFQREAIANEMVRRGGIGLAESFYEALKEKADERD